MATARTRKPAQSKPTGAQVSGESVAMSMVPYGEDTARRVSMVDQNKMALLARALVGTAASAAALNATVCSGQRLRVYRPTRGRSKLYPGRTVSKSLREYLTGDGRQRPSVKTMRAASQAGDFEEVTDCPFLDVMNDPDPCLTGQSFIHAMFWMHEMTGAAFSAIERYGTQDPIALHWLPSQYVTVVPSRTKMIGLFRIGRNHAERMELEPESMQYIRMIPHPARPWDAWTWINQCANELDCEAAAVETEMRRWLNGGFPGMALEVDATASKEEYKAIKEANLAGISGIGNAGKAFVLWRTKLLQWNAKPHEMGYIEGQERIDTVVYRHAQIPETIWKLADSNRASAAAGNPQYAELTIGPRIDTFAADMTENLLPMFAGTDGWFVAYDNPVREDRIADSDRATKLFSGGVINRNEARAIVGIESDPTPAGDAYATPATPLMLGAMPATAKPGEGDKPQSQAPAVDPAAKPVAGASDVQATALNGAQVTAMVDLATQVATGQLPLANAQAIARAAFPGVSEDTLAGVFAGLDTFTPAPLPGTTPNGASNADMAGRGGSDAGDGAGVEDGGNAGDGGSEGDDTEDDPEDGAAGKSGSAARVRVQPGSARAGKDAERVRKVATGGADGLGGPRIQPDGQAGTDAAGGITLAKSGWWFGHTHHGVKDDRASSLPPELEKIVGRMAGKLSGWYQSIAGDVRTNADGTIDLGKHTAALDALVSEMLADAFVVGGQSMADQLASAFTVSNQQALEILSGYRVSLATEVTGTVESDINAALRSAIGEGRTVTEASREIADALGQQADYRSERIARSEVSHLSNRGANVAMKEAGIEECEWLLAGGPCPLCESAVAARPTCKVGEAFWKVGDSVPGTDHVVTFRDVYGGDLHPQCRCGVAPIIKTGD